MGCSSMARATALDMRAETVTPLGFIIAYSSSNLVVVMRRETRKSGAAFVAIMLAATATCMPERGTGPSGRSGMVREEAKAGAEAGCLEAGAFPAAVSTSSSVMRPKLPLPWTLARSTLFFLAAFLAWGVAMMVPAGTLLGRTGPLGASFLAGAAPPALAFSTSEAVTRPPGPVPATVLRSMPRSSANCFASGDATTRSPPAGAAGAGMALAAGEGAVGAEEGAGAAAEAAGAETLPTSASLSTMRATGAPT
mmetsp:Transcript_52451/g.123905  ORF Transcript_52451/g.123905 Transcript_52451/m.123905 type:complete len:252 (-) Transcript_52451:842-1597(-)